MAFQEWFSRVKTMPVPQPVPEAMPVAVMEESVVAKQPVPVPKGADVVLSLMEADELSAYAEVAQELGFDTPAFQQERFKAFLKTQGLVLYDAKQVESFLTDQYGEPRTVKRERWDGRPPVVASWGWRPMRTVDRGEANGGFGFWGSHVNGSVMRSASAYDKAIPLPVLLTARNVAKEFPGAKFFVSDEVRDADLPLPVLDPFLMVEYGGTRFIIERWDEPNFRHKEKH